jgi:hypothetical protein
LQPRNVWDLNEIDGCEWKFEYDLTNMRIENGYFIGFSFRTPTIKLNFSLQKEI